MNFVRPKTYLQCQDCGKRLRMEPLSREEERAIARNPYAYVFFCQMCKSEHEKKGWAF